MAETNQLPAVAKTVFTECKKCGAERYHVVVAHKTATSAKVKCEICGASKTYKLEVAGAKKRPLTGAAAKKKEQAVSARKNAHQTEYQSLMNSDVDVSSYNMKTKYAANTKIKHPKFGTGFVRQAQPEKIEVVFEDEVRQLVHNRT